MKASDEEVYKSYVRMCQVLKTKPASFEDWQKVNHGISPWVSEKFQLSEGRNVAKRRVWD
jgi:hypothetical protein